MISLERIKAQLRALHDGEYMLVPTDEIRALVAEVERLRSMTILSCGHSIATLLACADGLDDEHTLYVCRECNKEMKEKPYIGGRHEDININEEADCLQPCGHPESAARWSGKDGRFDASIDPPFYCTICNEEAEAEVEVRRDNKLNTNPSLDEEE